MSRLRQHGRTSHHLATLLLLRSVPPPTTLLCVTFMETQDVKIDVIVIDVVDR